MDTAVQTFEPTPEPSPRPSANAPQLRTLLLTDLVDSTGLVERMGDAPASDLFRAHDRLVLQLQQQWHGRLIDRSDGMLLLFERPIDGLGFALDYTRGLIALGDAHGVELRARIGLHVGEVLTWRNSEEAVSVGAKPVEVEGLAKPMAARLMATARPGQILLSAVAEPLAHRAARELGERGQHLVWKSWGPWRFKGVPEAQLIFEVGEPGIAPLRMPPDTPKAWRDIPLWRRPAALAAEAALVAGLALGVWFIAKPEPAIAFNQRDWVVVGDLRNLTGQAALDDSLEQAFRISLEQSRHVNVLSDLKARDTLARMQREPDTKLDRAIASEIALRDGARAVILPTVAEVGGKVRISAEVIDPRTQTTVYAESAEGPGMGSTLRSIDQVTAVLRGKLGEAVKSIERDSVPLPQVTTKNIDALRAYALGQEALGRHAYDEALQFFRRATELDSGFALAWIGQMRVHYARVQTREALEPLRKAQALRDRLPPREAMYLDAWSARFAPGVVNSVKWKELAALYPDYIPALSNSAMWLIYENRFGESIKYAKLALVRQNQLIGLDHDSIGRARLALGEFDLAARSFDQAVAAGMGSSLRRRMTVEAARNNWQKARAIEKRLPTDDVHAYLERTSLALDQGDMESAHALALKALSLAGKGNGLDSRSFRLPLAVADLMNGNNEAAIGGAREAAGKALHALSQSPDPDAEDDAVLALGAALVAQSAGDQQLSQEVLARIAAMPALARLSSVSELSEVLRANQLRVDGKAQDAVLKLEPLVRGSERYQVRVALFSAYRDAGRAKDAMGQAKWLLDNRGLAYSEVLCNTCLQALNVVGSNLAKQFIRQQAGPALPPTSSRSGS